MQSAKATSELKNKKLTTTASSNGEYSNSLKRFLEETMLKCL